ncbi:MAG: hypothetical protein ABI228_05640 [Burkholderiaceae bacterium]
MRTFTDGIDHVVIVVDDLDAAAEAGAAVSQYVHPTARASA